jgi:Zn-dependent protease
MSDPTQQMRRTTAPAFKGGVSTAFIGLVLVLGGVGYELAIGRGGLIGVFVFVLVGWVVSLCLHEWGHAITAWFGGDRSVAERGYLTLNPVRYLNPWMSIVMPLAFLVLGGIGLPGGAVWVNKDALKTNLWRAAVSAAGPVMNLLCLGLLALALKFVPMSPGLAGAVSMLALLQATAVLLNLLPVPGLDGFGILETILPANERTALAPIAGFVGVSFLVVIFLVPQLITPLWNVAVSMTNALGVSSDNISAGYEQFRFWQQGP